MIEVPPLFLDQLVKREMGKVVAEISPVEPGRRAWVMVSKWPQPMGQDRPPGSEYTVHRYELPIKYLLEEWETDDSTPPYEHETYLQTSDFAEALRLAMSIEPDPRKWGILIYDHPDCPG